MRKWCSNDVANFFKKGAIENMTANISLLQLINETTHILNSLSVNWFDIYHSPLIDNEIRTPSVFTFRLSLSECIC